MNTHLKLRRLNLPSFSSQATTICTPEGDNSESVPFKESKGKGKEPDYGPHDSSPCSGQASSRISIEDPEVDKAAENQRLRELRIERHLSCAESPVGEGCSYWSSRETSSTNAYGIRVSVEEVPSGDDGETCEEYEICKEIGVCKDLGIFDTPGVALIKSGVRAVIGFTGGVPILEIPGMRVIKNGCRVKRLRSGMSRVHRAVQRRTD